MKARHVMSKMYPPWEWPKSVEAGQWYERLALLNNVLCTHAFFQPVNYIK